MLSGNDKEWLESVVDKIKTKMAWVSKKSANKIPYTTINGEHDDRTINVSGRPEDGLNWWTNGFWGGMMWLMYHETGEEHYKEIANLLEDKLDECLYTFYGLHHDVGFMWLPTSVTNYKVAKNLESRCRGLHVANLLAGRFNPVGEFIRAWNDDVWKDDGEIDTRGWAIIDCMLNIPLLYWATEETGDPRFKQIAMKHADTVIKEFVGLDGSVNHIVEFDPFNGGVVKTHGGQGYGNGSSWTRGQTWGIYGFLTSYKHTGKEEYLNTAKRIANHFIANIPEDGIIPVDFRQPKEPKLEDSTAAAIAACGLIEIAKLVPEFEKGMYMNAALKLLKTLNEKCCDWTEACDCILKKCTAAYHDEEHHFNIIYGDYYFMEAIFKLKGNDLYIW